MSPTVRTIHATFTCSIWPLPTKGKSSWTRGTCCPVIIIKVKPLLLYPLPDVSFRQLFIDTTHDDNGKRVCATVLTHHSSGGPTRLVHVVVVVRENNVVFVFGGTSQGPLHSFTRANGRVYIEWIGATTVPGERDRVIHSIGMSSRCRCRRRSSRMSDGFQSSSGGDLLVCA